MPDPPMTPSTALVMIPPRIFSMAGGPPGQSIRKRSSCSTILRGNNQPLFSGYGGLLIDGARDKISGEVDVNHTRPRTASVHRRRLRAHECVGHQSGHIGKYQPAP